MIRRIRVLFLATVALPWSVGAAGGHAQQLADFANALQHGNFAVARNLLDEPDFIHYIDADGQTALYAAAYLGNDDILNAVLALQPNVHQRDGDGATALHYAAGGSGPLNAANTLLLAGADANAADNNGLTPLMMASMNGRRLHANMLLLRGADPDLRDRRGGTALLYAVSKKHFGVVQLLLKHGASPTLGHGELTPLALARQLGHQRIAEWIERYL